MKSEARFKVQRASGFGFRVERQKKQWIPACAGMTEGTGGGAGRKGEGRRAKDEKRKKKYQKRRAKDKRVQCPRSKVIRLQGAE
jgi:hypothetical protein